MKKIVDIGENLPAFKINDYIQKTIISKRLMVDAGATSHTFINDVKKFKKKMTTAEEPLHGDS